MSIGWHSAWKTKTCLPVGGAASKGSIKQAGRLESGSLLKEILAQCQGSTDGIRASNALGKPSSEETSSHHQACFGGMRRRRTAYQVHLATLQDRLQHKQLRAIAASQSASDLLSNSAEWEWHCPREAAGARLAWTHWFDACRSKTNSCWPQGSRWCSDGGFESATASPGKWKSCLQRCLSCLNFAGWIIQSALHHAHAFQSMSAEQLSQIAQPHGQRTKPAAPFVGTFWLALSSSNWIALVPWVRRSVERSRSNSTIDPYWSCHLSQHPQKQVQINDANV